MSTTFHLPDLPSACVCCGTPYGLTRQSVRLRAGTRATHADLLFCPSCWIRRTTARHLQRVAVIVILVAVLGGAALAIATSSAAPAVVGTLIGILIIAGVLAYSRAAALRPATMPDGSPGIDIPGHGAFRLTPDNES